ncbi:hypothetical protein AVEN_233832-1 [Araneus ventricosus]|uniref:Uncharacterized protein n=1 Tax=Araneus ventricosus TaxID=182803 RepID=A0A4Y2H779_ARAVE|nr:hypothetical protein AVEN_233832-1 [Araneus ventricosus]
MQKLWILKIRDIRNIHKNGLVVLLSSADAVARIEAEIENTDNLRSNIVSRHSKKPNPRILYDIPLHTSLEEIQSAILTHTDIDQPLKLRFHFSGSNPNTKHWVFETIENEFNI